MYAHLFYKDILHIFLNHIYDFIYAGEKGNPMQLDPMWDKVNDLVVKS